MIHACGMVEIARDLVFGPASSRPRAKRSSRGAPIFCDSKMVANGITRARLPADNEVVCTLDDPAHRRPRRAARQHALGGRASTSGATGSAASLVAIGNAPTALVPSARDDRGRRAEAGGDHRHAGRLRRRGGIEGGAGRRRRHAVRHRRAAARAAAPWRPPPSTRSRGAGRSDWQDGASGTLYGVGTGPGDPELLTLKAVRRSASADVVAHFAKKGSNGNARRIVDGQLEPDADRAAASTIP